MVEAGEKPIVTLTGISGYLGAVTCLKYLKDGGFRVRGTVRDTTNEAKLAPLREAFGDLYNQLELRQADLNDEQSMIDAIAGSTYVCHMASPFFFGSESTEDTMVKPAVNGTLAAMKACKAAGVKRIVITSSIVSIQNQAEADKPADRTYNETMWSNPDRPEGLGLYFKSKTLAEKAAWDFQAALPADEKFEVVTICPAFIMGPPLRKEPSTSTSWMKSLLEGTKTSLSADHCAVVDVRDAAEGHLLAMKNPIAANRRFILCHSSPSFSEDYAGPVVAKYRPLGWPITENMGAQNPDAQVNLFDNSASKELGVVYTDFSKTMVDMADAMVALGTAVKPATVQ